MTIGSSSDRQHCIVLEFTNELDLDKISKEYVGRIIYLMQKAKIEHQKGKQTID